MNEKKCCVINYAEGQWYPRGQMRLVESLFKVNYPGDVLLLNWFLVEKYQVEMKLYICPNHQTSPYAFKYWAFEYARKKGYDYVLWLDCSFWAIKSLQEIFNRIEREGYVLQKTTYKLGNWCSDDALRILDLSRKQAFSMIMHDGGFVGLNLHNDVASKFLEKMIRYSKACETFRGSWTNKYREVSVHPKVLGHRHDMSVGTIVAHRLKMKPVPRGTYWIQKNFHNQYPNVCLLGQGM